VVNEGVIVFLNRIGASLITPDAAFDVPGNLGISQFLRVNNRRLGLDNLQIARFTDKSEACDYLVGFAEEHSRNFFGVPGIAGFADDLAFKIDDGISTDDD
jgi:hypothetical protein